MTAIKLGGVILADCVQVQMIVREVFTTITATIIDTVTVVITGSAGIGM